jgi:hypothetical protein
MAGCSRDEAAPRREGWPLTTIKDHDHATAPSKQPTLADALAVIKSKQFVDLTHAFEPGIPHWPGFPDEKRETLYSYDGDTAHLNGLLMRPTRRLTTPRERPSSIMCCRTASRALGPNSLALVCP